VDQSSILPGELNSIPAVDRPRASCPSKRPLTSAMGQKRTWTSEFAMSALPLKADIVQHGGNVRSVPKADIRARSLYPQ
jgi:hypothetical protein